MKRSLARSQDVPDSEARAATMPIQGPIATRASRGITATSSHLRQCDYAFWVGGRDQEPYGFERQARRQTEMSVADPQRAAEL